MPQWEGILLDAGSYYAEVKIIRAGQFQISELHTLKTKR